MISIIFTLYAKATLKESYPHNTMSSMLPIVRTINYPINVMSKTVLAMLIRAQATTWHYILVIHEQVPPLVLMTAVASSRSFVVNTTALRFA
jgi:hypothetical protein